MTLMTRRMPLPAIAMLGMLTAAQAQQAPQVQQNPTCVRLEAQLQAFDRASGDAARADQIRKYEEAAASQQNEIDRQGAIARRMGCGGSGFFVLFNQQPQQCGPLTTKIQQMRDNLDRIQSDLERMRGYSSPQRDGQRRAILVALSQNGCGQQYQAQIAATPPPRQGLFDTLFGPKSVFAPDTAPGYSAPGGTYHTVCVRSCDGYYYPISYATTPDRFADDEKTCRQSCPAAEVSLYSFRNPGEDVSQAVSISTQQPYTALPTAFRYRQVVDQSCSCRHPGESWAQALKSIDDSTIEQGDIVVNDQRSRALSQPRVDAQGRPIKASPSSAPKASEAANQTSNPNVAPPTNTDKPDPSRNVRDVGPPFIPAR
jgi:hypothetical protein